MRDSLYFLTGFCLYLKNNPNPLNFLVFHMFIIQIALAFPVYPASYKHSIIRPLAKLS